MYDWSEVCVKGSANLDIVSKASWPLFGSSCHVAVLRLVDLSWRSRRSSITSGGGTAGDNFGASNGSLSSVLSNDNFFVELFQVSFRSLSCSVELVDMELSTELKLLCEAAFRRGSSWLFM
jgi:hypothetical protein